MNETQPCKALQDDGFIPRVPYVKALPEGLKDQTFITIHGQPESNADRFSINFYKGDDVAFHFNPRFNEDGKEVIVRNSKSGDFWQNEERELSFFPFTPGKPFEIEIICTSSGFTVKVDNYRLLNFSHRMRDIENLTMLVIDGNIILKHVAVGGFLLKVPYVKALPEGLKSQTVITIHGQPTTYADRFSINFYKGDDIAFHFNPRFNEEVIVRNSRTGDVWQNEERELSFFPFTPGKPFEIKIFCTYSEFRVEVDDYHLLNFSHRMNDLWNLTTFVIGGNIVLKHVTGLLYDITSTKWLRQRWSMDKDNMLLMKRIYSPPESPEAGFIPRVPYVKVLPDGLKDQTFITIHGQPTTSGDRFSINFYKGDDIAFHFNPRFNEEVIVRNSKSGGVWQNEEKELSFFPFKPGKPFEITIICTSSKFSVKVDNYHLLNFSHRMKDIENLTTLVIDGNIILKHVAIGLSTVYSTQDILLCSY
ncbi:hypothetical protein NFI96_001089 [Prochilodus magdalenae]|nr:hypothetical protein NFI96_001089 [Prochilodus magdalenae]